jgi:hypothetical protein
MMKMIVGGLAALTIAGGIVAAAPAHADTQGTLNDKDGISYTVELEVAGYIPEVPPNTGLPDRNTSMAYSVCTARGLGYSEDRIRRNYRNAGASIDAAIAIVNGAEFHFCPGYEVNTSPSIGPVGMPLWFYQGYDLTNPYGPPHQRTYTWGAQ